MIRSRLLLALYLAVASAAAAQTVPVVAPNTVGPSGTPTTVGKTFIVNPDGSLGSVGASVATAGNAPPASGTLIMGTDGTAARTVSVATNGSVIVQQRSTASVTADARNSNFTGAGQTEVVAFPLIYNGTNFDRQRDTLSTNATTGIGVQAVGIMGVVNPTLPTYAAGQMGQLNMSGRGALLTSIIAPNGNYMTAQGAAADAVTSSQTTLATINFGVVYNGTSWDRTRDVTAANATTGTGVAAVGPLGAFNTTLPTFTNGQLGELQMTSRGVLRTTLTAINGNDITATGAGDGLGTSNTLIGAAGYNLFYDPIGNLWNRGRGDTNGSFIIDKGGSSLVTGQVSVGTTATLIAAARPGRQRIGVTVTSATQCAFGNAGVTLATGWPLAPNAYVTDTWATNAALYAICAATATVGFREQF